MLSFNINDGFLEALLKGFKNDLLKKEDYIHLTQCDNLDDLKVHLQSSSGFASVLANEASPIDVMTIEDRLREKLVSEFNYLRVNSVKPLSEFLDFITYSYMIDNVVLLIAGTLNDRPLSELIPKCNPLGIFDQMEAVIIANTPSELYNAILVDTPLAEFFQDSISMDEIPEMDPEIIRNVLFRSYLEKFHAFVDGIGGQTGEVIGLVGGSFHARQQDPCQGVPFAQAVQHSCVIFLQPPSPRATSSSLKPTAAPSSSPSTLSAPASTAKTRKNSTQNAVNFTPTALTSSPAPTNTKTSEWRPTPKAAIQLYSSRMMGLIKVRRLWRIGFISWRPRK